MSGSVNTSVNDDAQPKARRYKNIPAKVKILNAFRAFFKFPILESLLLIFTKGKSLDHHIAKIAPNHYQYTKPTIRRVTRNNIKYELDISDLVEWFIYFGFCEKSQNVLYEKIVPGNTIFDIGANVGLMSLEMAHRTGPNGAVISFEPDSHNYLKLTRNIDLNPGLSKVIHAENKAVSEKSETLNLCVMDEYNRGMNRVISGATSTGLSVDSVSLDKYIRQHGISKVNVIKIDVEGFEWEVIKGARDTIIDDRPIMYIEIDDQHLKQNNSSAKEIVEFLVDNGYFCTNASTAEIVTPSTNFDYCHFDMFATPRSNHNAPV